MSEWIVRALGLFYCLGGVLAARLFARERVVDAMLATVSGGWQERHRLRAGLMALTAVLTALSGLALLTLDRLAVPLMAAAGLVQALWLVWGARAFPAEDGEAMLGRRRTRNAFLIWLVATVVIAVAAFEGVVELTASPLVESILAVVGIVAMAVQLPSILKGGEAAGLPAMLLPDDDDDDDDEASARPTATAAPIDPTEPHRWIFAPNLVTAPMCDGDTWQTFDVAALKLPPDLTEALEAFEMEVLEYTVPSRDDPEVYVIPADIRASLIPRLDALVEQLRPHAIDGDAAWWLPPAEEPEDTPGDGTAGHAEPAPRR